MLERLGAAATAWNVALPPAVLHLVAAGLARPLGDGAYARNRLMPAGLPFEWSFSAADPAALRFELQPYDPLLAPGQRLALAQEEVAAIVVGAQGPAAGLSFRDAVKAVNVRVAPAPSFGAFAGFCLEASGALESKLYVELDAAGQCDEALSDIAGVQPHFLSISSGPPGIATRTYYLCHEGLRLLDLETVCARLGLTHRYPALIAALLDLTEMRFYLPPTSVLLGIRRRGAAAELKLELSLGEAVDAARAAAALASLPDPAVAAAYAKWARFTGAAGRLGVISVRVATDRGPQFSLYAGERGGP